MRTKALIAMLVLPVIVCAAPRHSMFPLGETVDTDPIGMAISYSMFQTQADLDESPTIALLVTTDEACDIYAEARAWSSVPWNPSYLIGMNPWCSEVFGWEIMNSFDGVTGMVFAPTLEFASRSINEFFEIGSLHYQARFKLRTADGDSKWFILPAATQAPASPDVTAPVVGGTIVHTFAEYGDETSGFYSAFSMSGALPVDATFGTSASGRIRVNYGDGWVISAWETGDYVVSREIVLPMVPAADAMNDAYGDSYEIEYEFRDGAGNSTGWTSLPDGDLSDYVCEWDRSPTIFTGTLVDVSMIEGAAVSVSVFGNTYPCLMETTIRVSVDSGAWTESKASDLGLAQLVNAVVVTGSYTSIDVEYKVSDGIVETAWTALGTYP